jgi:hypothetical protein
LKTVVDPPNDVDRSLLCCNIVSHLTSFRVQLKLQGDIKKDTHLEKVTRTCEDHFCGREDVGRYSSTGVPKGITLSTSQTNPFVEGILKSEKDVNCRAEQFSQALVGFSSLIEVANLALKNGNDGSRGVAGLNVRLRGMSEEVSLHSLLDNLNRGIEDRLKIGRG